MGRAIDIDSAKMIMGNNIIGPDELKEIDDVKFLIPQQIPFIPYSKEILEKQKDDYFLILGVSRLENGEYITIRKLKELFGVDPNSYEPCFYNQDWYEKEDFVDIAINDEWFLIRKEVYENSRTVSPDVLSKDFVFPSAIKCCYAFFVAWLGKGEKLWYQDYVWCNDTDHNGDRIYVGKYHDVDNINKNGFSVHRHLSLRSCYGCID